MTGKNSISVGKENQEKLVIHLSYNDFTGDTKNIRRRKKKKSHATLKKYTEAEGILLIEVSFA